MSMERFEASPVGRLVPIEVPVSGEMVVQRAFVPHELREAPELTQHTWSAVVQAAVALGRLGGMARDLSVEPSVLAGLAVRREALSTSALEGTYAPVTEVLAGEISTRAPRSAAVTEVLNFVRAAEYGVRRLAELPVCVRLARELHEILVSGTPSEDWQKGRVRETQVVIEPGSGVGVAERIARARFVPTPPGDSLLDGLRDWERWIHDDAAPHPLVRIAVSHYLFEALHPFTDGNGRIGRLLAVLQLIEAEILPVPLMNLSPYFEVRRDTYLGLLEQVSLSGAWDAWVTFFCEALAAQAAEGVQRIGDLLNWRDETVGMLRREGLRGAAREVVEALVGQPVVTARSISERHGVTPGTAHQVIRRLAGLNVLEEITGGGYAKVYASNEVLSLLHRSPV